MIGWAAAALAGPLDAPDPDDLGKYRCVERPLDFDNPYALGDRAVGSQPPGPPWYADGLGARLTPFTTDDQLKKAGKGAGAFPAPAVASLATAGLVVKRDCENRATTTDHYFVGCKELVQCEVIAKILGQTQTFDRRPQAGAKLAPVESPAEAVGLAWFLDPDVFLPLTPGELAAWKEEAAGYAQVEPPLPWVEVEEHDQGYVVRVPRKVGCGCRHDLVRRAYWISKDGRSCPLTEPGVPLALATSEVCAK